MSTMISDSSPQSADADVLLNLKNVASQQDRWSSPDAPLGFTSSTAHTSTSEAAHTSSYQTLATATTSSRFSLNSEEPRACTTNELPPSTHPLDDTSDGLRNPDSLLQLRSAAAGLPPSPTFPATPNSGKSALQPAPAASGRLTSSNPPNHIDLRRQLCDQNVFVFHLPSEWTEEDLRREFGRFGSILSFKVVKRPDGSSKGYGFVCFKESRSAFASVKVMNGKIYGSKRLKVSMKKTPEDCLHLQVQKLIEIADTNRPYDKKRDCTLFVFHLPSHWNDRDMYRRFQPFGSLTSAKIAKKENCASRGYGFVTYDNPRSAALAIANMNGTYVGHNKRLKVQLKQQPQSVHPLFGATVFVFHLPHHWTEDHLNQNFSNFGKILSSSVQRDSLGASRGYGFITFERHRSALGAVIGMNGYSTGHKRLKVSLKRNNDDRRPTSSRSEKPEAEAADLHNVWQSMSTAEEFRDSTTKTSSTMSLNRLLISMDHHQSPPIAAGARLNYYVKATDRPQAASLPKLRMPPLHHDMAGSLTTLPAEPMATVLHHPSATAPAATGIVSGFNVLQHLRVNLHGINPPLESAVTTTASYQNYFHNWNGYSDLGLGR